VGEEFEATQVSGHVEALSEDMALWIAGLFPIIRSSSIYHFFYSPSSFLRYPLLLYFPGFFPFIDDGLALLLSAL